MIDDACARWIMLTQSTISRAAFDKLKVAVGPFMALSDAERSIFLVSELKRDLSTDLKLGLGQFEPLLNAVGLGGSVPDNVRRTLFYGQQLRNLVAHRGAVVDIRFKSACPELGYEVNDHAKLSSKQFFDLVDALSAFAVLIADRVRIATGLSSIEIEMNLEEIGGSFSSITLE